MKRQSPIHVSKWEDVSNIMEHLIDFNSLLQCIIRVIKSRRLRRVGHVARMEEVEEFSKF